LLANAYIPTFLYAAPLLALLAIIPTVCVEAVAIRFGRFRNPLHQQFRPRWGQAFHYAILANVASALPGIVSAVFFYSMAATWAGLGGHYVVTCMIELAVLYGLGLRLSGRFVVLICLANLLTYLIFAALAVLTLMLEV
jgi:hypothetical protein